MPLEPFLLFLAAMVYLLVAGLFLRSERLVGMYKWLFSLAFLPVFLLLMFANIWVADHLFPNVLAWHQNLRGGGGSLAFLISAFIPVTVCCLWYTLFVRLSQRQREMPNLH